MRTKLLGALFGASLVVLSGCGGGTDIAPSAPTPTGTGIATALLNSEDQGSTELVETSLSPGTPVPATIVDELGQFGADNYLVLDHGQLDLASIQVRLAGPPGTTYTNGTDFTVADQSGGVLERSPGAPAPGPIPINTDVLVTYTYSREPLTASVGVTFVDGDFIELTVFNLDADAVAPVSIGDVIATAPPPSGALAWNVTVLTKLLTLTQRRSYSATSDSTNTVTLTNIDFSNPQSPCLAGTLHVVTADGTDQIVVDLDFEDTTC